MLIEETKIKSAIINLLRSEGVPEITGSTVADALIWASARGISSHGIRLLEHYRHCVQGGRITTSSDVEFEMSSPTVLKVNCNHSFGHHAGTLAVRKLCEIAKNQGIAVASVINSNHCGAMGYYSQLATNQNMIGIAMTQATARMPAPQSQTKTVGNNPISFGFPSGGPDPIIFDAAQSKTTFNAVNKAKTEGTLLDDGLILDTRGRPTNNPKDADQLVPIGEYKGFGLAMCVDLLTGGLGAQFLGDQITQMFDNKFAQHRYLCQFYLVINPGFFPAGETLAERVTEYVDRIRSQPALSDRLKVTVPHDPEMEYKKKNEGLIKLSGSELDVLEEFLPT